MMAVAPALAISSTPSGKGKKASEAATVPFSGSWAFIAPILAGIYPAHLSGADADGLAVARIEDRVGLHVLANFPGEQQGALFFRRGRALGDHFQVGVLRGRSRYPAPAFRRKHSFSTHF